MARLVEARPDVVLQASYVKDAVEIRQALARGRSELKALVGHITLFGPRGEDFVGGLRATGEHSLWTLGWWSDVRLPGVDVNGVCDRFQAPVGFAMDGNGALNYTAAWVVRDVLERAGSGTGSGSGKRSRRSRSRSGSRGTSGTTRSASARTDRTCTRGPSWSRSSAGGCAPCGPSASDRPCRCFRRRRTTRSSWTGRRAAGRAPIADGRSTCGRDGGTDEGRQWRRARRGARPAGTRAGRGWPRRSRGRCPRMRSGSR